MGLQRATIQILQTLRPPGEQLYAPFRAAGGIQVRFNPTEYTLSRNVNYADVNVPGLETPVVQFVRGESQTLALELFLDRSDRVGFTRPSPPAAAGASVPSGMPSTAAFDGIDTELQLLRLLVTIDDGLHAPPVVLFTWGKLHFTGVVGSYSEKFAMFDDAGNALRARVTMTLKKYAPPQLQARSRPLESPDRTKTRTVQEGDRIDAIAAAEYGDASKWPAIARANNLARPRILVPGTLLVIPPL